MKFKYSHRKKERSIIYIKIWSQNRVESIFVDIKEEIQKMDYYELIDLVERDLYGMISICIVQRSWEDLCDFYTEQENERREAVEDSSISNIKRDTWESLECFENKKIKTEASILLVIINIQKSDTQLKECIQLNEEA